MPQKREAKEAKDTEALDKLIAKVRPLLNSYPCMSPWRMPVSKAELPGNGQLTLKISCKQHGENAAAVETKRKQLAAAALSSSARRAKQFYEVTVRVSALGQLILPLTAHPICFV